MHIDKFITVRAEEVSKFIRERGLNLPPEQINRIIRKATENLTKIRQEQLSRLTK